MDLTRIVAIVWFGWENTTGDWGNGVLEGMR
jgi:hypothetical protein